MSMTQDDLMLAMDRQQPDWPIRFADQQDLTQLVLHLLYHLQGNEHVIHEMNKLRSSVAGRLFMPCRAAVHAGHLGEEEFNG